MVLTIATTRGKVLGHSVRLAAAALCVAVVGMTPLTPVASAEPAGSGRVADAPTLGMRDLGANPTLGFYGMAGKQSLTIPVPQGLRPVTLTGDVELPVNIASATIAVVQDDRTVSRVDLPPGDRAPLALALDGAEVKDNALTIQIRTNLVPPQGYCSYDDGNPLTLANVAVAFAGVEQPPANIADFLPPVLQRLTLFVPATPTMAESDAAVRMAGAVVAHYGAQPVRVTTAQLPGDDPLPPADPFERQIVIRESGTAAMTLLGSGGIPSLLITGPAADLTNQTRLIASEDVARVALSSRAVVGPLELAPIVPANSTTLRDLGQSGLTASSLTGPKVVVGIDQTRLGRPARRIRVHLRGSYTPLPSQFNGQLVVTANGESIDHWAVEGSGTIDREVAVPDRLLQRRVDLTVAINAAGTAGQCGVALPLTLTIDGDSTVTSDPADPPIPPGFQSLPQALMPRVQVGITDDAFADTSRATTLAAGLQRLSAVRIDTSVVKLQDAIASPDPAVLVSADKWTDAKMALPVDASQGAVKLTGQTDGGDGTSLTLNPDLRLASLQTMRYGNRTLLVATSNGAPEQLDSLLSYLNDDPRRWERLGGAAILSVPDRDPVLIAAEAPPAPKADARQSHSTVYWLVGAGVLVVAAIVAGLLVLRSRRRA